MGNLSIRQKLIFLFVFVFKWNIVFLMHAMLSTKVWLLLSVSSRKAIFCVTIDKINGANIYHLCEIIHGALKLLSISSNHSSVIFQLRPLFLHWAHTIIGKGIQSKFSEECVSEVPATFQIQPILMTNFIVNSWFWPVLTLA